MNKDNRKYPRFNVKWPVVIQNDDSIFKGEIRVMSANGGFIRSEQFLEPDKTIHLTINIPEDVSLTLDAKVVSSAHSHPDDQQYPYSIGVQFEKGEAA